MLTQIADIARRTNGEAIVLCIGDRPQESEVIKLKLLAAKLLTDVPYQIITTSRAIDSIVRIAEEHLATTITIAKNNSIFQQLLDNTAIPITST